jgi:hypothetical protein
MPYTLPCSLVGCGYRGNIDVVGNVLGSFGLEHARNAEESGQGNKAKCQPTIHAKAPEKRKNGIGRFQTYSSSSAGVSHPTPESHAEVSVYVPGPPRPP